MSNDVPAEDSAALTLDVTEAKRSLTTLQGFKVESDVDLEWANGVCQKVKERYAILEARRKDITGPLLESKRKVDALFKPATDGLLAIEILLKRAMGDYALAQQKERARLMQESAAAYQAGETPTAIIPEPAKADGLTIKAVWRYKVTDMQAVPRHLCVPDDALIKAHLKCFDTHNGPKPVSGLEFYLDSSVTVRK